MSRGRATEGVINTSIGQALDQMRRDWTVRSEVLGVLRNADGTGAGRHPDVYIEEAGMDPVIIENEIEPHMPDDDAERRLEQLYSGGGGRESDNTCGGPAYPRTVQNSWH